MNKYASNHVPAKTHSFRGQDMTTAQIAKILGVSFSCISRRIKAGTPLDRPSLSPRRRHWDSGGDSEYCY